MEFLLEFEIVVYNILRYTGATVRWLFLYKQYSYGEVMNQKWNKRVGMSVIILLMIFLTFKINYTGKI